MLQFCGYNRIIVAAVVAAAAAGCERASAKKASRPAQSVKQIEVVRPERRTVQRSVGEPGELEAVETTPIHAKIAGYVRAVNVDIGSGIKRGEVLAELWVPEVEADLQEKRAAVEQAQARKAQAEAAVKVAQAAVASAEAKLTEARAGVKRVDADVVRWQLELRRVEQLFNERAQTGSLLDETRNKLRSAEAAGDEVRAQVKSVEAALSEARSELDKARSDVLATAATIEVAQSEARHAEAMLGYARIEAPFDGVITRRNVDTGHLTKPGSDAPPLFIADRTDVVTIVVDVPESYSTEVDQGDSVLVKIQAMKGRTVEGKVTRTAWALDPRTRTLRTEIDIPNPGGKLRPGLYAYATVIVAEHKDVLTIPTSAVARDENRMICTTVVDGKAVRKAIETGLSDGVRTEVVSGLEGDELVVKTNDDSLVDGQYVRVQEKPTSEGKPRR